MSHRHHPSVSNEVSHIIADLKNLSSSEIRELYRVEVWEDGQVYDFVEDNTYTNVTEWANHYVDADTSGYDDLVPDKYADMEDGEYN